MARIRLHCTPLDQRDLPSSSYILNNEYADVQVNYAATEGWSMFIHDDDQGVAYPALQTPPSSVQYVHPTFAQRTRPTETAFDFIGVPGGGNYYFLPQVQDPNLLYHGVGAEEVAPGTFDNYDAGSESNGRVTGVGRWVKLQLVSVTGPGAFSVWQDAAGGPRRFLSSFNDGIANPEADGIDYTDGINADDAVWVFEGAHLHMNFGFTALGRYDVVFRPVAHIGGTVATGPDFHFTYSVGNVGQLGFEVSDYVVNEAAGNASITLTRSGGSDGSVQVDYATNGGSAVVGVDYTSTAGTLLFDDLETTKSFTIPILNDSQTESPETIGLTLSNFRPWNKPGGDISDPPLQGTITAATLTIQDDDSGGPPPTVASVTVNAGAVQRSRVTQLSVIFSSVVTLGTGAFELRRLGDNVIADVSVSTSNTNGQTVATLTFAGALSEAGSLADGNYRLTAVGSAITGVSGAPLDGDGNGTPGGDFLFTFHRLFGDADGDRDVDLVEFSAFRAAFGATSNLFDSDNDSDVDLNDFSAFRSRFGSAI